LTSAASTESESLESFTGKRLFGLGMAVGEPSVGRATSGAGDLAPMYHKLLRDTNLAGGPTK
jgi:hypothetical protein